MFGEEKAHFKFLSPFPGCTTLAAEKFSVGVTSRPTLVTSGDVGESEVPGVKDAQCISHSTIIRVKNAHRPGSKGQHVLCHHGLNSTPFRISVYFQIQDLCVRVLNSNQELFQIYKDWDLVLFIGDESNWW